MLEKHCEIDPEDDLLKDDDDFLNFMERKITITGNNRKITFRMSKKNGQKKENKKPKGSPTKSLRVSALSEKEKEE